MDIFKRTNIKQATAWDWNCPKFCKRQKGDTERLHRLSRRKLKQELKEAVKNEDKM